MLPSLEPITGRLGTELLAERQTNPVEVLTPAGHDTAALQSHPGTGVQGASMATPSNCCTRKQPP